MNKNFNKILLYTGTIGFLLWCGARLFASIDFDQKITGHLELAARADSIHLAQEEIGIALSDINKRYECINSQDECYTSIIWKTQNENVKFWKNNIESAYHNLSSIDEEVDPLTRATHLIKLRGTLTGTEKYGGGSVSPVIPKGISIYPYNRWFTSWLIASILLFTIGGINLLSTPSIIDGDK